MLRSLIRSSSYKLPGTLSSPPESSVQGFIPPSPSYKPSLPLKFNSKGETLVYSSDTQSNFSVFFPIPWSLGTWSIPVAVWQIIEGNLSLSLPLVALFYSAILPHCYHLYNLRFTIDKIWYVRGGAWKIENSGIQGLKSISYTHPDNLTFTKGSQELDEQGNLKENLVLEAAHWMEYYEAINGQKLKVLKAGTVHNPELFQAMLQKVKVDDSEFEVVIGEENYMTSKVGK